MEYESFLNTQYQYLPSMKRQKKNQFGMFKIYLSKIDQLVSTSFQIAAAASQVDLEPCWFGGTHLHGMKLEAEQLGTSERNSNTGERNYSSSRYFCQAFPGSGPHIRHGFDMQLMGYLGITACALIRHSRDWVSATSKGAHNFQPPGRHLSWIQSEVHLRMSKQRARSRGEGSSCPISLMSGLIRPTNCCRTDGCFLSFLGMFRHFAASSQERTCHS